LLAQIVCICNDSKRKKVFIKFVNSKLYGGELPTPVSKTDSVGIDIVEEQLSKPNNKSRTN
jgi:hypothetical protein